MRKKAIVGLAAAVIVVGGGYGISSVFADQPQPAGSTSSQAEMTTAGQTAAQAAHPLGGKRLQALSQYTTQIHQLNQLQEERLDLRKQIVQKRDQLLDLLVAAKNSGNKQAFMSARDIRKQYQSLNGEIKSLLNDRNDGRQALKEDLKADNSQAGSQLNQLISTSQQVNEKLKSRLDELNQLIDVFNTKASGSLQ